MATAQTCFSNQTFDQIVSYINGRYALDYPNGTYPFVLSVAPSTGPVGGGTAVTVTGSRFVDGATVTFDGVAATSVVFVSATALTCVAPAGSSGAVILDLTPPLPQTFTTGNWPFAAFNTQKFHFTWTPTAASTDPVWASGFGALLASNDDGGLWVNNRKIELYDASTGLLIGGTGTLTWAAGAAISVTGDRAANLLTVTGATTGGGSFAISAGNIFSNVTLGVGVYGGGGNNLPASTISDIDDGNTAGTADIVVTNPDEQTSGTLGAALYTYGAAPVVSAVTPSTGTFAGGTAITNLAGTGFLFGAVVTFDGVAATSVVVVSALKITCVAPAGAAGTADIVVTNTDAQTSGASGAALFTYFGLAPTVTSASPAQGTESGTTAVTVTGAQFVTGATITFGGVAATSVVFVNSTTLTCVAPAGTVTGATCAVLVTNPDTQTGTANAYQYLPGPALTSTRLLWYRADVATVAGGLVSAMPDLSGYGDVNRNLHASGDARPGYTAENADYNDTPSIDYTANPQNLVSEEWAVPIEQTFTVYIIGGSAHANSISRYFSNWEDTVGAIDYLAGGLRFIASPSGLEGSGYSSGHRVLWAKFAGASSAFGNNKISASISGAMGTTALGDQIFIGNDSGSNFYLEGEWCEFVILAGHDAGDHAAMCTYLQARSGLTMSA